MIFVIKPGLSSLYSSVDSDFLTALENLASSHRNGCHLILGRPDEINSLLKINHLSRNTKHGLNLILNISTQIFPDIDKLFPTYFYIDRFKKEIISTGLKKQTSIGLDHFLAFESMKSAELICENLLDCEFYSIVGDLRLIDKKLKKSLSISFDHRNGGGSTTPSVFLYSIEKKIPALCIIDSDIRDPLSEKQNDSIGKMKKHETTLHKCFCTESLEIENIIPFEILNSIISSVKKLPLLAYMSYLYKNKIFDIYYRIDLKKGLTKKDLRGLNATLFSEIKNAIRLTLTDANFLCLDYDCKEKTCTSQCTLFEGGGEKILRMAMEKIKKSSLHNLHLDPETCSRMETIFDNLIAFGTAAKKTLV